MTNPELDDYIYLLILGGKHLARTIRDNAKADGFEITYPRISAAIVRMRNRKRIKHTKIGWVAIINDPRTTTKERRVKR